MEAGKTLKETEKELLRVLEKGYEKKGGVSAELFLEEDVNARTDINCYVFEKEKNVFTGFLSTFLPNEEEAEVTIGLFTEEKEEKERIFTGLVERAREEWRKAGLKSVSLVVDRKNEFPLELLTGVGCAARPVVSEFLLNCELERLAKAAAAQTGKGAEAMKNGGTEKSAGLAKDGEAGAKTAFSEGAPERQTELVCKDIGEEDGKVRQYLLFEDGKELCRCSILLFLSEKAAYLYGLETAADYRRRGAATRLIAAVSEKLMGEDWKEMTLQVSSGNVPALKLYQKLGFTVKEQRIYYRLLRTEDIVAAAANKAAAAPAAVETRSEAEVAEKGNPAVPETETAEQGSPAAPEATQLEAETAEQDSPAESAAANKAAAAEEAQPEAAPEAAAESDVREKDRAAKERAHEKRMERKKDAEEKKAQEKEAEDARQAKEDAKFMREALKQAKKAAELGEVPIGCVLVQDGKVIARGYNRRNTDKTTLAHAELAVIKKGSSVLSDWRLENCTMYITLEPCPMCAGAIVQARIPRVVAGCMNPKAGCAGSVLNILRTPGFNHMAEFTSGVLEEECSALLQEFFKELRRKKAEAGEPQEDVLETPAQADEEKDV